MKILIFDPDKRGHHLQYVRILGDYAAKAGHHVVAAVQKGSVGSPEGQVHLIGLQKEIELDDSLVAPPLNNNFQNARIRLTQLTNLAQNHQPDRIFIPYGDGIIRLLGLGFDLGRLKRFPIETLIFRGLQENSRKTRIISSVLHRLCYRSHCQRIHFLSPLACDNARRISKDFHRLKVMPEPVENFPTRDAKHAKNAMGFSESTRFVSCLGMINKRKNVASLIDSFLLTKPEKDTKLLLVGKQDVAIASKIHSLSKIEKCRIVELNEYVANETFLNAIAASDLVVIPYKNRNASSGIMVRAVNAGKKVIVDQGGQLGWLTRTFGLGATCDVSNHLSFSDAITKCLNTPSSNSQNSKRSKLQKFNTIENFCRSWMDLINIQTLGSKYLDLPISWESVID